jgi:hypothetical protein
MIRFAFLILILFSLLAGSCSDRKNKPDKRNLIPEKELVPILVDIHIANGLFTLQKINFWYSSLDSITSYYQIIEKHGYTKEIMDKTMKYYFLNNPRRLNKIYDQALVILSEMESRVEKESIIEQGRISKLWPGRDFYSFPNTTGNDSTLFDITLIRTGIYTLSFSATLYPDDQSVNPRVIAYLSHPDSIETGRRRYIKTIVYIKDGQPHTYILTVPVPEKTILHLRGWLYNFDNLPYGLEKHAKIENISFTYRSVAV